MPRYGRAVMQDNSSNFSIVIPTKKDTYIIFLSIWLGGWLFGEIFMWRIVHSPGNSEGINQFLWGCLIFWTIGGPWAISRLIWRLIGEEIIAVGEGKITIQKKGQILGGPRDYDLNKVRNIRALENDPGIFDGPPGFGRGPFSRKAMIRFQYEWRTVKFAYDIDAAEARFILEELKERRFLTESNFL
jgi:hypothetical protein